MRSLRSRGRLGAAVLAGLWACVIGASGGCATTADGPPNPLPVAAAEYTRLFDAATAELRDAGFVIERRDHRFGRLTTRPLDVPTTVEFWRPTPATPDLARAGSLAHLRRRVVVTLEPAAAPAAPTETADGNPTDTVTTPSRYALGVEVQVERAQRPRRRLDGSASGNVFSNLAAPSVDLDSRGQASASWAPVGRDVELEAKLLRAIVERSLRLAG